LKFTLISPFLSHSTRFLGTSFTPSPLLVLLAVGSDD
jgi:hypothetical protein